MTGWDVLNTFISSFSPIAASVMVAVAAILFIIGFYRHGMDFVKHGTRQNYFDELLAKLATKEELAKLATKEELAKLATKEDIAELRREFKTDIAELRTDVDGLKTDVAGLKTDVAGLKNDMKGLRTEMDGFRGELDTIKVNHFGHLKNFLTELTSILVDKGIINNENKARLDNQLSGM